MNPISLVGMLLLLVLSFSACSSSRHCFDTTSRLEHSKARLTQSLQHLSDPAQSPRNIKQGEEHWATNGIGSWTSGFYPGLLWYMYAYTGQEY